MTPKNLKNPVMHIDMKLESRKVIGKFRTYVPNGNIYTVGALFLAGIVLCIVLCFLGWEKLHHGLCIAGDEGMHYCESWTMARQSNPFTAESSNLLRMYSIFNAALIRLFPDISALDFRKIQFFAAITTLTVTGLTFYLLFSQYWYIPLVFSLFLFTGLDPTGNFTNLNYYTYSHFFFSIHLSMFLLGGSARPKGSRAILFLISGVFLVAISLSMLPFLGLCIVPALIFVFFKKCPSKDISFTLPDVLLTLFPPFVFWALMVTAFPKEIISKVLFLAYQHRSQLDTNLSNAFVIAFQIFLCLLFCGTAWFAFRNRNRFWGWPLLVATSVGMSILAARPFFGFITLTTWYVALLIAFISFYAARICYVFFSNKALSMEENILAIIVIACAVFFCIGSIFSGLGAFMVLYCSIPATLALIVFIVNRYELKTTNNWSLSIFIILFLFPFYYSTAIWDWKFTFYDVSPDMMDHQVESGFAKGIKTNRFYAKIFSFIEDSSVKYSKTGDYMAVYLSAPMIFVLADRKPALDHIVFNKEWSMEDTARRSVEKMKNQGKYPKIAYLVTSNPFLRSASLDDKNYFWMGQGVKDIWQCALTEYIENHMIPVDWLRFNGRVMLQCYVDPYLSPEYYRIVNLKGLEALKRNNATLAMEFFSKAVFLNPKGFEAHYNMARAWGLQMEQDQALNSLQKALDMGFSDLKSVTDDPYLEILRDNPRFKKLLLSAPL